MFREMRRKNQQLPQEECNRILQVATSGVLAVDGDDDYPYAVPLSFVYEDGRLYFHPNRGQDTSTSISRGGMPASSFQ